MNPTETESDVTDVPKCSYRLVAYEPGGGPIEEFDMLLGEYGRLKVSLRNIRDGKDLKSL